MPKKGAKTLEKLTCSVYFAQSLILIGRLLFKEIRLSYTTCLHMLQKNVYSLGECTEAL